MNHGEVNDCADRTTALSSSGMVSMRECRVAVKAPKVTECCRCMSSRHCRGRAVVCSTIHCSSPLRLRPAPSTTEPFSVPPFLSAASVHARSSALARYLVATDGDQGKKLRTTYRIDSAVVRRGQKWTRQASDQTRRRIEQLPRRAVRPGKAAKQK
jgi:hypothetical protein